MSTDPSHPNRPRPGGTDDPTIPPALAEGLRAAYRTPRFAADRTDRAVLDALGSTIHAAGRDAGPRGRRTLFRRVLATGLLAAALGLGVFLWPSISGTAPPRLAKAPSSLPGTTGPTNAGDPATGAPSADAPSAGAPSADAPPPSAKLASADTWDARARQHLASGRPDMLDAFALARALRDGRAVPAELDLNADGTIDTHDVDTLAGRAVALGGKS